MRNFGLLLLLAGVSLAQVAPLPVGSPPGKADAKKATSVEVMTFPSDRDAKNMIQAVKDYLKEYEGKPEKAPWDRICQAAQQVLDAKSDSFFELPKASADAPQGRVSAKAEINRLIGQFPSQGRQFYQLAYGATAENLLAQSRNQNFDRAILADASQRYFHTKAGAQATLLLAAVQLERGNYVEAAYSYERLLNRPDSEDLWNPLTTFKAIAAMKRAGTTDAEAVKKLQAKLEKSFPRDGLTIGRKNLSLEDINAELTRPSDSLFGKVSEAYIAMRYGNPSHTALLEGGKPFLDATWAQSMFYNTSGNPRSTDGNNWVRQNLEDVLKGINPSKQDVAIPGFFPATAQDLVFIRSYSGVYAFVAKDGVNNGGKPSRAGDLYWYSPTAGSAASLLVTARDTMNEGFQTIDIENYWRQYRDLPSMKSILYENPLVGSMTHDGRSLYLVDDAAIPPPPPNQNEQFGMPIVPGTNTAGKGRNLIDGSRLKAVNMKSGMKLWDLGDSFNEKPLTEEQEDKSTNTALLMQNSFFLGPPLPLNGKLYVLYERNGVIRLACLDPYTIVRWDRGKQPAVLYPALLWTQRLGEPNARLPADSFRRFQCSYLAFADGVMICPTNAGAVVAVDVMSKSLLWARSYRTVGTGNTTAGGRRPVMINADGTNPAAGGNSPMDPDRWRAAAPIVAGGRVVFAAFDAKFLYCLDLRTGDVIWKEPRKATDLYIGGLIGDKVLIVGKDSLRALKLQGTPKKEPNADGKEDVAYAWKDLKIGLPAGHGVAAKDGTYYLPIASSVDDPHPQVWAVDVAKGEVLAKASYRRKDAGETKPMLGNLAFHDGQLYSQSPLELTAFPLLELKKQSMNQLLSASPKNPDGLLARGELLLDEGNVSEAIKDFETAKANTPSDKALARLNDKLFIAYTEVLRKDFASGERFLADYKTLCNLDAAAEDPNLKLKQMEERTRRQRMYLELVARGRESQGKFTEAFDLYREFAGFGGNKELVSLSDEPNGKTRPDVWARGRIEAMLHNAKDDASRKNLEGLVLREWTSVKDGSNVAKLREFVGVFGPHFGIGRDAELLLGTTLAVSEKDADTREAGAVLSRLAATSEDPVIAAKAVEMLAKLATKHGQADAAVSYYTALGTKYATVKLRENYTGADLFNDLLTDKRLLPFLEPARLPTPSRIKAVKENTSSNYVQQGYVIEPEGSDREPFYQRHRLMLSNNDNGGGGWVLRVYDRGTGEEKWKVPGLQMFNPNGSGALSHRIAQGRGSLLLLHMGMKIHCFDLAEKRQCWEYPVFGENHRIDFNNQQVAPGPDDELILTLDANGTKMTLGRGTILETHYAAMITKDGLVAIDPVTGSKLWVRSNISPSSMIFGDARHIFVVETVNGKSTSKVLRAVDGGTVENVPDFAPLVTGAGRVRIVGRNILHSEGGRLKPLAIRLHDPLAGKDVWRKEYEPMAEPEEYKLKGLEFNGQAKLMKTYNPELTGAFGRDGTFEVLSVHTGDVVFKGAIDKKNAELHASMCGQPVLLGDAERFYLVLNKTADPNRGNIYYGGQLRSLTVNGPMYCFEKATGKRAWYTEKLFENQSLIVERFGEMPALVSATHTPEEDEQGVIMGNARRVNYGAQVYRVVVIDKVNGRLRYMANLTQNNNFYAMSTDPRTATAKLIRGDLNVVISPDDGAAAAVANGVNKTSQAPAPNHLTPERIQGAIIR